MNCLLNRIGRLTPTKQLELRNEIFLIELCQLLVHVFEPVLYTINMCISIENLNSFCKATISSLIV